MKNLLTFLFIGIMAFSFTSCELEEEDLFATPTDEEMQPAVDNSNAEKGIMSASSYMNPYGLDEELSSGKKGFMANGPSYSWVNFVEFIIRIDFTDVPGMGGAIIVDYESNPFDFTATSVNATFSLENYEEDGIVYNGDLTFSMTRTSVDQVTMVIATVDGTTLEVTKGSVNTSFTGTRTIEWLEGLGTPGNNLDDLYQLSGYSTGVSSTGTNYRSEILTPIVMDPECNYIMSGSQQIINNYQSDNETTLTMTYNVDASGNELSTPTCNSYFKLHFVSGILDVTLVLNIDEM
jgi:hypothetical protein